MNKKEQPVRFEPRKCSLWFSNPLRYHLSYLDFIDQWCIYPIMKGKSQLCKQNMMSLLLLAGRIIVLKMHSNEAILFF